jgi:hypothetical protein
VCNEGNIPLRRRDVNLPWLEKKGGNHYLREHGHEVYLG